MSILALPHIFIFFFFNDTATTEIYTLSLHDALPISFAGARCGPPLRSAHAGPRGHFDHPNLHSRCRGTVEADLQRDRKSTRLNSSHTVISYAVFCLKKKINSSSVHTLNQIHNRSLLH